MLQRLIDPRRGMPSDLAAVAGEIGEYIESEVLVGSAVSLVNVTAKDVTSISLSAGDWDVWGCVGTNPGSGTTTAQVRAWTSSVSNTAPTAPNKGGFAQQVLTFGANAFQVVQVPHRRFLLASTTTVYLGALVSFGVSTMSAYGFIGARRVR